LQNDFEADFAGRDGVPGLANGVESFSANLNSSRTGRNRGKQEMSTGVGLGIDLMGAAI
jgi:hypothetical protein